MQRLFRRRNQPPPIRGRAPARWTAWEIALITISLLLIVFPIYTEAYRWLNPQIVPAAPALQRETFTPIPSGSPVSTPTPPPGATATPTPPPGATATPTPLPGATATPTPLPTATPTPFIGEPPLTVSKVASVASAGIGEQFSYSISVFSNSAAPRQVIVRDTINAQLEIIGTPSASNGSCSVSGNTVTCNVSARSGEPATITINVRVRSTATPGARISNQAIASDANDPGTTASSDEAIVEITSQVVVPTATGQVPPTNTIGPGTPPPTSPPPPTNTVGPGTPPPTSPPPPGQPQPTEPPRQQPQPTTPPRPPLPPTPAPGQPLPPTPAPGQPPRATPRPGSARATPTPAATAVAPTPVTPTVPTPEPGLFFRMASDWGSAFPGQEVNYVIAVVNTRSSGALRELRIVSVMPANLEVRSASSDAGIDPTVAGNEVSLKLDALQPGKGVEIAIATRIKDTVAAGTRIVSQAQLTTIDLPRPAYSNIVTVLVVGAAPPQVTAPPQATTAVPAASAPPTATATPAPMATATTAPSATPAATPTAAPTPGPAGAAPQSTAPLPATSSGVPIFGFALLGMTLMLRTYRLHRAQSRL